MRSVTGGAALGLDGRVLIDERASLLRVTLDAHHVPLGRALQVLLLIGAVRVVAVSAFHQPLVHFVIERHGKQRLDVGMTLETERGLGSLEQSLFLAAMDVVTTNAAYVALAMGGAVEVLVLASVAAQAHGIHLLDGCFGRVEYFGCLAARLNVRATCAVAPFAGNAGLAMRLSQLAMRVGGEARRHFLVASSAGFGAHKILGGGFLGLSAGRFSAGRRSTKRGSADHSRAQRQYQTSSQPQPLPRNRTFQRLRLRPISMHEKFRLM